MSRRANPKLVGAFVLAAIALLVGAALVFGSFTFFEVTRRFVVFFQGSVDGLTQGSAVLFRGVPLGRVVDVGIRYDPADSSFEIPVIIEIRPNVIGRYSPPAAPNTKLIEQLINAGLRARLESASLVTGQQVVQLNFFPGTPIRLEKTDLPYDQIPTVPSPTQQKCLLSMSRPGICRPSSRTRQRFSTAFGRSFHPKMKPRFIRFSKTRRRRWRRSRRMPRLSAR